MTGTLLHLCTPTEWRAALASGAIAPPSLDEVGFVHLSTPDQVHLPANRLFAGRGDMLLLAVAAERLDADGIDVRWEPGVPGDPDAMRFPHAYGPIPVSAVRCVLPYRPDGDGRFVAAAVPALDDATRARVIRPSILRRAATREVEIAGGVAVLTDAVPTSPAHNRLLVDGPVDAATVAAESDRVLGAAGLAHGSLLVSGPDGPDPCDLRALGWTVDELVTMAAPVAALDGAPAPEHVGEVGPGDVRPLFDGAWVGRYELDDDVADVRAIAASRDGQIVAAGLLTLDGGTALLDALRTAPAARRRGHATAVVRAAVALAAAAGCDLLTMAAEADDWPRAWFRRLGFREVGTARRALRA